ncbi:MAG: hypothetical protein ACLPQS_03005 [Acidimicrobiales bacterium]
MARAARRLRHTALLRTRAALVGPLAVAAAGVALTGCGSSAATSLAHQACAYVTKAANLQREANLATGARAKALESQATRQLELAEPLAAEAAGDDGSWQALQANLAETSELSASMIVPAAKADCVYNGA